MSERVSERPPASPRDDESKGAFNHPSALGVRQVAPETTPEGLNKLPVQTHADTPRPDAEPAGEGGPGSSLYGSLEMSVKQIHSRFQTTGSDNHGPVFRMYQDGPRCDSCHIQSHRPTLPVPTFVPNMST